MSIIVRTQPFEFHVILHVVKYTTSFDFFFPTVKNVKSFLSTLVLQKQVVDQTWPVGFSLPTSGLDHDVDRTHFSISGSIQIFHHPSPSR